MIGDKGGTVELYRFCGNLMGFLTNSVEFVPMHAYDLYLKDLS